MVKKILGLLLAGSLMLTACGKKEEVKAEAPKKGVVKVKYVNNPLPQFSLLFAKLDNLGTADFDKAVQEKSELVENDVYQAAFQLGRLTADAVLATKSRNKSVLQKNSKDMIEYSKLLGLSEEILKLADELQELVKNDKWDMLTTKLDAYKFDVEMSLYDTKEYDLFTLLQLGGWTEGLDRICFLLNDKFDMGRTEIISQKGITNALLENLANIENEKVKAEKYYQVSFENFSKIKEILYSSENSQFTEDQVKQLFELTQMIKKNFI